MPFELKEVIHFLTLSTQKCGRMHWKRLFQVQMRQALRVSAYRTVSDRWWGGVIPIDLLVYTRGKSQLARRRQRAWDREETRRGWILPNASSERPRVFSVLSSRDRVSQVPKLFVLPGGGGSSTTQRTPLHVREIGITKISSRLNPQIISLGL